MRAKSAQPVQRGRCRPSARQPRASGADRVSAQPGQGDLGVRSKLVGLYEVVQALLGLGSPLCPDSDQIRQHNEMSRCAISGLMHRNKTVLFDHLVGDHVPSDGASSRYPNPGLHDHPLVGQFRSSGI